MNQVVQEITTVQMEQLVSIDNVLTLATVALELNALWKTIVQSVCVRQDLLETHRSLASPSAARVTMTAETEICVLMETVLTLAL